MSSPAPTELAPDALGHALSRWLRTGVAGVARIGGGRNSQVYKVTLENATAVRWPEAPLIVTPPAIPNEQPASVGDVPITEFVLKVYFRHAADKRDRLATEYQSFTYLWANGFRDIPKPLAIEPASGWAAYEFIAGDKIPPGQAGDEAVLAAADFLDRLRGLSRRSESRKLGIASEAFFAPALVAEHVRQRFNQLQAVQEEAHCEGLREFLSNDFTPLLEAVIAWSQERLRVASVSFTDELGWDGRTLSPSDFGFHNALRRSDGRLFFLDFEYFGWDDPAKMISDFLLHPAMNLSAQSRKTFAASMFRRFADWPGLQARVESVYPLFGLKWCLIFLNEFLPNSWMRRQFAATASADPSVLRAQQLDKARLMAARIRREYASFPYHD